MSFAANGSGSGGSTGVPKSIAEMRGMPAIDRDRERPFSARSYAAQYGITVEDAEYLIAQNPNHRAIEREIAKMFKADEDLKRRALLLDEGSQPSEQEKRRADRLLASAGLPPLHQENQENREAG